MRELETGETYEHERYGTVQLKDIVQHCETAEVEADESLPEAVVIDSVTVKFYVRESSGFGPVSAPLGEFVEKLEEE